MQNQSNYKLRCTLPGHSKDVRCVTVGHFSEICIVSGSRDKTAKLWTPEGSGFVSNQTLVGHEGYVSSVAVMFPSPSHPSGAVVTGCQDGKLRIYDQHSSTPSETLAGHTDTVCSIIIRERYIFSGSWDKTAKIWQDNSCILTLSGHAAAIWAVEVLVCSANINEIVTLTASADKTIKMWKGNSPFQIFKGHTDCVRALAVCNPDQFLSAANDATIRLWVTSGECLATFYGHANYIYGLSLSADKMAFVSCGEDRSVRVWRLDSPNDCQQTIYLPAQSVWTVSMMDNGDIVTGSSDGLVRVFTNDPDRVADPEQLKSYEEELAATSLTAQQELGGIKINDLPGPESLLEPGKKEGQTKLVRQGQSVSCYSWSSSDAQWTKVGDVMGAASDPNKTLHEGKEYDFVFTIDVDENQPPLKLPYNCTEDPWLAAQKFIHKHDLSQYYLDTVANFIIQNSGGNANRLKSPGGSYTDPFTGGSRYVPSTQETSTGASGGGIDPFTGSGRYVPPSSTNSKKTPHSFFPIDNFIRFEQANVEAITKKLKEFNGKVEERLRLSDTDLSKFVNLANNGSNVESLSLLEILLNWPSDYLIPVLDVLRLATRHPQVYQFFMSHSTTYMDILMGLTTSSVANCMLVYRIMAHFVSHYAINPKVMEFREGLLASGVSTLSDVDSVTSSHSQWKNVQIAIATVVLNFAILFHDSPKVSTIELKSSLLNCIVSIVTKIQDEEALFRTLAGVGTLISGDEESLALAQSLNLYRHIEHLQQVQGKVGGCAKEILAML